ncbi:hypothetical protein AB2L27_10905 [Kineococcus sp. LSe6-4]|uniref:Uncharacterized protein n=1 Tax=Kineococcus halophytocola TaxID=3234027 RepID=A0ABV4H129_9ACTN
MTTESVLVLVAVALVVIALSAFAVRRARRRRARGREDALRAGQEQETDGEDAALRSMGRNAWMRGGGGGV